MNLQIRRINRALLIGWGVITSILFLMYWMEVLRGARTISYIALFSLFTILPFIITLLSYFKKPESESLKYLIVVGYSFTYAFVLFTANTPLVFTYILPMLSLLVLYHTPKLISICGAISLFLNFLEIGFRWHRGEITDFFDKDLRIQIMLLILCFVALYFATVIYDSIYRSNLTYNEELKNQREELHQQAEELEALNGELNMQADELQGKNDQLQEMTMQTIMTIANTIDAKDEYTRGHSRRVSEYSVAIAEELGYTDDELRDIQFTGLLHDIGKIGVPDNVLNKPGRLTNEEYQLMKDHTTIGGEILKDITIIHDLDIGAKYHHERYDGTGYPEGLKGEKIPVIARIIGVADAYDAMTSNRIYRRHLDHNRVINELKKGNGTQFDPDACSALLKLIEEDRLPKLNIDDEPIEVKQTTQILTRVIDKAEETALEDLQFDELTGTLIRENGIRHIQTEIGKNGRGSIFVFDLDHFRKINEKKGFSTGDKYLSLLADEIRKISQPHLVSRFGPDEFVAYLPTIDREEEAEAMAEQFIAGTKKIAEEKEVFHMFSVSIGITQVATEKDRVMVLYENASKALFVAKQYGDGQYFYHRNSLNDDDDVAIANSADLEHLVSILTERGTENRKDYSHIAGFDNLCESVKTLLAENDSPLYIVLFTLRIPDREALSLSNRNEIMSLLETSIRRSIRDIDIMIHYSNVQHALLLVGLDDSMVRQIINKIMTVFYRANTSEGIEIHYDVADIRHYTANTNHAL